MGKIPKTHNPGSDNQADQFETNDGSRHLADSPTFVIQVVLLDFLQLRETILFGHTERPCKPPAIKIIVCRTEKDLHPLNGDDEVDDVVVGAVARSVLLQRKLVIEFCLEKGY